jgi:predicted aminopeptidase
MYMYRTDLVRNVFIIAYVPPNYPVCFRPIADLKLDQESQCFGAVKLLSWEKISYDIYTYHHHA